MLLGLPLLASAQVDLRKVSLSPGVQDSILGTSIVLKDKAIIFSKVYESTLTKEELTNKIKSLLPSVKSFQLTDSPNQTAEQFSGRFTDYIVNYRKYGGTLMGTPMILNNPLNANVIIQVKDYKYRVIVSDIIFKGVKVLVNDTGTDILADDFLSRNKRQLIRSNSNSQSIANYLNKDFTDNFDITKSAKIDTNF